MCAASSYCLDCTHNKNRPLGKFRFNNYLVHFALTFSKPIGLAIGLDQEGKGLTGW